MISELITRNVALFSNEQEPQESLVFTDAGVAMRLAKAILIELGAIADCIISVPLSSVWAARSFICLCRGDIADARHSIYRAGSSFIEMVSACVRFPLLCIQTAYKEKGCLRIERAERLTYERETRKDSLSTVSIRTDIEDRLTYYERRDTDREEVDDRNKPPNNGENCEDFCSCKDSFQYFSLDYSTEGKKIEKLEGLQDKNDVLLEKNLVLAKKNNVQELSLPLFCLSLFTKITQEVPEDCWENAWNLVCCTLKKLFPPIQRVVIQEDAPLSKGLRINIDFGKEQSTKVTLLGYPGVLLSLTKSIVACTVSWDGTSRKICLFIESGAMTA